MDNGKQGIRERKFLNKLDEGKTIGLVTRSLNSPRNGWD